VNLIPRFFDATEGAVLVDGIDVRKYRLSDLYAKIGYVPQSAVLFGGDIKGNVAYGSEDAKDADARVRRAIEIAHAAEFVDALADGVNSRVAQGGKNVSGGQRQRLSIARAICRDPEIFIFDDSFSALDYKTDRSLRRALARELSDKTRIIVAARIGTIMDADKILVLDAGTVVGIGRHRELLQTCEVYREIAYSQLSEEELLDD
jgi:ATP-binding cassette subfamily B protein